MDRAVRSRRFRPGLLALVAVVLLAAGAGVFGYVKYGLVRTVSVSADRLSLSQVRTGLFRDYVPTTGVLAPRDTVILDSIDGGQVVELLVEEGAMVRAGQPLLRLANRRRELEVSGRESQFTEQENSLVTLQLAYTQNDLQHQRAIDDADHQIAQLEANIARVRPALEKGFYRRAEFEDMERDLAYQRRQRESRLKARDADSERIERQLAALRENTERQRGSLGLIREGLANLTVTAPIDGQLTVFDVQPGQAIGGGQRIGQVDRIDSFKVTVMIDEFYLGRIATGQPASASIGGKDVTMRVAKVYPDVRERRFQADLEFEGAAPQGLRAGQSVQLRIELGEQPNSLIVDNGAFYEDSGGTWVFVVSPDGASAVRRDVRMGRRNPEAVEVLSGLAAGERIITSTYQPYREAERINIGGGNPSSKARD